MESNIIMSYKYTYQKEVNPSTLKEEIQDSPDIKIAVDYITSTQQEVEIYMKSQLPVEEEIVLTNIVANHDSSVDDVVATILVNVVEETGNAFTGGSFQTGSFPIDIDEEAGKWNQQDHVFPFNIAIISCDLLIAEEHVGNILEVCVAPHTVIGNITANAEAGATEIFVSPSVLDNIWVGYFVSITENPNDDNLRSELGRVLEKKANSIIVETPVPRDYSFSTPTYVEMTVKIFHNWEFPCAGRIDVGDSKIGASNIPANTIIRVRYLNKNGGAKRFILPVDYLY
jgi:hypothetical protein